MSVLAEQLAEQDVIDLRDDAPNATGVLTPLHRKRPSDAADPLFSPASDATKTAVIVARALLEVLSGQRPAKQLTRWTSYPLQQDLERRAPRKPTGARLQLRRVKVSEPAPGVAEVCALADDPAHQRVRVIAMRLEERHGGWIVTRLQAG